MQLGAGARGLRSSIAGVCYEKGEKISIRIEEIRRPHCQKPISGLEWAERGKS